MWIRSTEKADGWRLTLHMRQPFTQSLEKGMQKKLIRETMSRIFGRRRTAGKTARACIKAQVGILLMIIKSSPCSRSEVAAVV